MYYAANASKLHRLVGEVLSITPPFSGMTLQQEVIVSSLFKYPNNRDKYDWVVPELFLVIEVMGEQHFKPGFNSDAGEALLNFKSQQFRDSQKKEAALLAGWTFIEIPFTDKKEIASKYLLDAYTANYNPSGLKKNKLLERPSNPDFEARQNRFKEESNRRRREYNRSLYKKLKQERKAK